MRRHLLLEGPSGIGKSTLINKSLAAYNGKLGGFSMQRVTIGTKTTGFYLAAADHLKNTANEKPRLFLKKTASGWHIRYDILIRNATALLKEPSADVILLDEIGGGELTDEVFASLLRKTLSGLIPCIGVIKSLENFHSLSAEIKMPAYYINAYMAFRNFLESGNNITILQVTDNNINAVASHVEKYIESLSDTS